MDAFNSSVLSDQWKLKSISAIEYLQDNFSPFEEWIVQVSQLGDNRAAFAFYFPVMAGVSNLYGAQVLWAAVLVEWSNLVLKWCFKAERPFWWIHETSLFNDTTRPLLKQFPETCESGPGTPSGHVMMNAAVFYVFIRALLRCCIWSVQMPRFVKKLLSLIVIVGYVMWVGLVLISRLYIQAHFVHQCFLAVFLGVLAGHVAWSCKSLVQTSRIWAICTSGFLCGSSLLTYYGFLEYGMDPLWAIPKALKYCTNPAYVKVDTQPYFIMVRFSSAALGAGYALSSFKWQEAVKAPFSYIRALLAIKAGILVGRLGTIFKEALPPDDLHMYLSGCFLIHLCIPFIVLAVIPSFILSIFPPRYK